MSLLNLSLIVFLGMYFVGLVGHILIPSIENKEAILFALSDYGLTIENGSFYIYSRYYFVLDFIITLKSNPDFKPPSAFIDRYKENKYRYF